MINKGQHTGMKLQDVKMTDQITGHETARHEITGNFIYSLPLTNRHIN